MRRFGRIIFLSSVLMALLVEGCVSAPANSTQVQDPTSTATTSKVDSPSPTVTATPSPQPTLIATATPTATPVVFPPPSGNRGGTLIVMAEADIPHRDVHQEVQETLTSLGPGIAYSRLLRLRIGPQIDQPSLLLECELCQEWTSIDPFTYKFRLRPGIQWQNLPPVNGRTLTSEDIAFSYKRLANEGWPNSSLFQSVKDIQVEDDGSLKITLHFPDADFLLALADGHSKIVAKEAVAVTGNLTDGPVVGSSPWIWKRTLPGVGSDFERNPNYFEEALPFLDELSIRVMKASEEERYAAFATGVVDVYRIPPGKWLELQTTGKKFGTVLSKQGGVGSVLAMNVSSPPFDDIRVRKAVLKALDPWEYVDTIWSGEGFVSLGLPVVKHSWLLGRDEMRDYFGDPSAARKGLAELNRSTPLDIDFTVADYGKIFLRQGKAVEDALDAVGFNVTGKVLTPSEYAEKVMRDKEYEISLGVLSPTNTANSFLMATLHSGGQWNLVDHSDEELDLFIEKQAVELDPLRREEHIRELQRYILEKAYMFSPVTGPLRWVYASKVKGFHPNTALSEYSYWARTWIQN